VGRLHGQFAQFIDVVVRNDHYVPGRVRESIQDNRAVLAALYDARLFVIPGMKQIAKDAAKGLLGGGDVGVPPRCPEIVHGGRVADAGIRWLLIFDYRMKIQTRDHTLRRLFQQFRVGVGFVAVPKFNPQNRVWHCLQAVAIVEGFAFGAGSLLAVRPLGLSQARSPGRAQHNRRLTPAVRGKQPLLPSTPERPWPCSTTIPIPTLNPRL